MTRSRDAATPEPVARELSQHRDELEHRGFTVLEAVADHETVDEMLAELERVKRLRNIGPSDNDFEGRRTVRVYNLLTYSAAFRTMAIDPVVLPLVETALGPDCLLSTLGSIAIGPDESDQPIHADDQAIPIARPHAPLIINAMWALTDFTRRNGATRVVPGSHLAPDPPQYGGSYTTTPVTMARGSVLVWNGSLWHAGGANHATTRRVGISVNYCAGFLRQEENQQLGVPRALVTELPDRMQSLIGYGTYLGVIGHIEKESPGARLLGLVDDPPMRWETDEHAAYLADARTSAP